MKKFDKEEFRERIKNHRLYKRALESKRFLILLMIIIILISYNYFTQGFIYDLANNNLQDTLNFLNTFGNLSWLVYLFVIIFEVLLAPIPGVVMYSSAAIIFKPLYATLLSFI